MTTALQKKSNKTNELRKLSGLAKKINDEHKLAEEKITSGLSHALNAGNLLIEAKHIVSHGKFEAWIHDNLTVTARQAQKWMRAVNRWSEIEAKANPSSLLTLNDGLKLIADYRDSEQKDVEFDWADILPQSGEMSLGYEPEDAGVLELIPSAAQGFVFVSHFDFAGDHTFQNRAINTGYIQRVVSVCWPDLNVGTLTWITFAHPVLDHGYHPSYSADWLSRNKNSEKYHLTAIV